MCVRESRFICAMEKYNIFLITFISICAQPLFYITRNWHDDNSNKFQKPNRHPLVKISDLTLSTCTSNFGFSMKNFQMIFHFYDGHFLLENVRKTPPAKRLTKNQIMGGNQIWRTQCPIVLPKMLTVFFSIHNPPFSKKSKKQTNKQPIFCSEAQGVLDPY